MVDALEREMPSDSRECLKFSDEATYRSQYIDLTYYHSTFGPVSLKLTFPLALAQLS